ncbi:T6SS effector phospholipase Tle3 domain-containing protein [Cupriavidus nantongensis]
MSHQADYSAESLTLPGSPRLDLDYPALLPGVVIYVHGVNSTGEWFEDSEAAMRYDQNAAIRQKARRYIYAEDGSLQSDSPYSEKDVEKLDAKRHDEIRNTRFGEFAQETRMGLLAKGVDQQASNHSTILTNPAHSEQVLAYDVDVGVCYFNSAELDQLRRMADWRWCKPRKDDADSDNDNEFQYYASAELGGVKLRDLARYNSQLEEEGQPNCLDTLEINRERNTWPLQANNRAGGNDSVTA